MSSIDRNLRIADFLHVLDDRAVASQVLVRHEQFVRMGHRPVVICATRDASANPRIPEGVEILDLGIGRSRTVNALPRLVVALRSIRPDVLFAQHTGPNRTAILARMIGRIDSPIIVSECTHYSSFGWDHRAIRTRMTAALYPHADRIVGVSARVVDDLVAHFPAIAGRTAVIPPAGPDGTGGAVRARSRSSMVSRRGTPDAPLLGGEPRAPQGTGDSRRGAAEHS
jgi:Glycosyltransferase Family 4